MNIDNTRANSSLVQVFLHAWRHAHR
jgi:hypothetical protein